MVPKTLHCKPRPVLWPSILLISTFVSMKSLPYSFIITEIYSCCFNKQAVSRLNKAAHGALVGMCAMIFDSFERLGIREVSVMKGALKTYNHKAIAKTCVDFLDDNAFFRGDAAMPIILLGCRIAVSDDMQVCLVDAGLHMAFMRRGWECLNSQMGGPDAAMASQSMITLVLR